jgi:tRNA pseudouridine38-40 synthase
MRNIKLTIEYDGTQYSGWQRQKNSNSIQQCIEEAIKAITGEEVAITGSSRTDAGVHARGQVANFLTETSIPCMKLPSAFNSRLPRDICILEAEDMPMEFHSRYDSKGKRYSYTILNRRVPPAYMRSYVAHCPYMLDYEAMVCALEGFKGTHDFAAFKSTGSSVKTSIRTVKDIQLVKQEDIIRLYIEADGFLYNMVRIVAGTLMETGMGKIAPSSIPQIIESRDRNKAGKTAPAAGLCLEKVLY